MNITELKALADDLVPLWDNGSFEREDAEQARDAINELIAQLEQMTADRDSWAQQASDRVDDAVKFAAQLEDAQGEIRALRATEAGLLERVKELEEGLMSIHEWNSHTVQYSIDYGSNGVRDFYRGIARALLEKQQ